MAESKPNPVTYHEYDIPGLNTLFAWSAAALLAVSVWMIAADYNREWKGYQRRFNSVQVALLKQQLADTEKGLNQKKLESLKARLAQAREAEAGKRSEIAALQGERDGLAGTWYAADQAFKFAKAELDVARYEYEEAQLHRHEVEAKKRSFERVLAETEERRKEFETLDARVSDLDAKVASLEKDRTAAQQDLEHLLEEKTRLESRLAKLGQDPVMGVVNWFRDRPLLDFAAPSLKVKQVVLPELHEDVNFLSVPRVDRCHTCHLGIDTPGHDGEDIPPVFRTHSRYELLIQKHPVERFGCTGCHAGSGRAMTFSDAAHTPRDARQAERWKKQYDWHPLHHWDFPMLPLPLTEAGCANCHEQEFRVPGADKLNAGRQVVEEYGCSGCHKFDRSGYDEIRKVGPELAHIADKVGKDWMFKWLKEPRTFRPSTRMPRFWGNSNTRKVTLSGMDYPLRDDVEAEAVVRYLLGASKPYAGLPEPPAGRGGDAARGKWVVENRGCQGCHVVGKDDTGEGRYGAHYGPELNQVGSKLSSGWLYAWLRDPKAVWADTRMPDLRLTDQEALDAAAYLLDLRNPEFEAAPAPDLSAQGARTMLETVTLEYLRKETTLAEAQQRLTGMDEAARYTYLGKKLILRYGCFGCHDGIAGFENAQRIGTELTTWASKLLTQLDFGLVHEIPHTKQDWLRTKLSEPRVFDRGKEETKHPQDLLRMPDFGFTPAQVESLVTNVMSFQRDMVQPSGHRNLDTAGSLIERGSRLIHSSNCRGCHVIENQGGGLEDVLEGGMPYSPPVLVADFKTLDGRVGRTEQGEKVNPEWFFGFLKAPTTIRPWLNVRMPSFGFSDPQASDVVKYFAYRAGVPFPYEYLDPASIPDEQVAQGEKLFVQFKCVSCHLPLEEARKEGVSVDQLAPNLELAKRRLRYEWLHDWLKDPGILQKDTRMPSYFYNWDEDEQAYLEAMPEPERKVNDLRAYLQFHGAPRPRAKLAQAP